MHLEALISRGVGDLYSNSLSGTPQSPYNANLAQYFKKYQNHDGSSSFSRIHGNTEIKTGKRPTRKNSTKRINEAADIAPFQMVEKLPCKIQEKIEDAIQCGCDWISIKRILGHTLNEQIETSQCCKPKSDNPIQNHSKFVSNVLLEGAFDQRMKIGSNLNQEPTKKESLVSGTPLIEKSHDACQVKKFYSAFCVDKFLILREDKIYSQKNSQRNNPHVNQITISSQTAAGGSAFDSITRQKACNLKQFQTVRGEGGRVPNIAEGSHFLTQNLQNCKSLRQNVVIPNDYQSSDRGRNINYHNSQQSSCAQQSTSKNNKELSLKSVSPVFQNRKGSKGGLSNNQKSFAQKVANLSLQQKHVSSKLTSNNPNDLLFTIKEEHQHLQPFAPYQIEPEEIFSSLSPHIGGKSPSSNNFKINQSGLRHKSLFHRKQESTRKDSAFEQGLMLRFPEELQTNFKSIQNRNDKSKIKNEIGVSTYQNLIQQCSSSFMYLDIELLEASFVNTNDLQIGDEQLNNINLINKIKKRDNPQIEIQNHIFHSDKRAINDLKIDEAPQSAQNERTFKIFLQPSKFYVNNYLSSPWPQNTCLEFQIRHQSEYIKFKQLLTPWCLIAQPSIESEFQFERVLGTGSQASVELHSLKVKQENHVPNNDSSQNNQEVDVKQYFAIKKYIINSKKLVLLKKAIDIRKQLYSEDQGILEGKEERIQSQLEKIDQTLGDCYAEFELIFTEIKFLRELNTCENIVDLNAVYLIKETLQNQSNISKNTELLPAIFENYRGDITLALVMNFAKHGSLTRYLQIHGKLTEESTRTIMAQLLLACDLMHRKGIIHRDLKADNLLIHDRKELKICISDLGLACLTNNEVETKVKCGTPGFVAPEVLNGHKFTTKADIFSLGCLFYAMIQYRNLYEGREAKDILMANKYYNPQQTVRLKVTKASQECIQLLEYMVNPDPDLRPSAEDCLNHPWFKIDQEAVQSSLFINKNHDIIEKYLNDQHYEEAKQIEILMQNDWKMSSNRFNDNRQNYQNSEKYNNNFCSFVFGPNYFQQSHNLQFNSKGALGFNENENFLKAKKPEIISQGKFNEMVMQKLMNLNNAKSVEQRYQISPLKVSTPDDDRRSFVGPTLNQSQQNRSSGQYQHKINFTRAQHNHAPGRATISGDFRIQRNMQENQTMSNGNNLYILQRLSQKKRLETQNHMKMLQDDQGSVISQSVNFPVLLSLPKNYQSVTPQLRSRGVSSNYSGGKVKFCYKQIIDQARSLKSSGGLLNPNQNIQPNFLQGIVNSNASLFNNQRCSFNQSKDNNLNAKNERELQLMDVKETQKSQALNPARKYDQTDSHIVNGLQGFINSQTGMPKSCGAEGKGSSAAVEIIDKMFPNSNYKEAQQLQIQENQKIFDVMNAEFPIDKERHKQQIISIQNDFHLGHNECDSHNRSERSFMKVSGNFGLVNQENSFQEIKKRSQQQIKQPKVDYSLLSFAPQNQYINQERKDETHPQQQQNFNPYVSRQPVYFNENTHQVEESKFKQQQDDDLHVNDEQIMQIQPDLNQDDAAKSLFIQNDEFEEDFDLDIPQEFQSSMISPSKNQVNDICSVGDSFIVKMSQIDERSRRDIISVNDGISYDRENSKGIASHQLKGKGYQGGKFNQNQQTLKNGNPIKQIVDFDTNLINNKNKSQLEQQKQGGKNDANASSLYFNTSKQPPIGIDDVRKYEKTMRYKNRRGGKYNHHRFYQQEVTLSVE